MKKQRVITLNDEEMTQAIWDFVKKDLPDGYYGANVKLRYSDRCFKAEVVIEEK